MHYVLSKKEDYVYNKILKAKIETKMQYINFYVNIITNLKYQI
jgi:hypothetical protein